MIADKLVRLGVADGISGTAVMNTLKPWQKYEYRRCGMADLFVAFAPLACRRVVKPAHARTA